MRSDANEMRAMLVRAGVSAGLSEGISDDDLPDTMDLVAEIFAEREAPDKTWWQDLYSLTGEHMVLTDEGWCPAEFVEDPCEVLLEVNAP